MFPTIRAGSRLLRFESTSQVVVSALIACNILSRRQCCGRRGIIWLAYRAFEGSCQAFGPFLCTCIARFHAFATIETVGTADALSLTAPAGFLEFRGNDVLAINAGVIACCAWIVLTFFNE
jgi:hypothetical protein